MAFMILYTVITLLAFILLIQAIGFFISAPKYTGPVSDHFDGKKFINPGNVKAQGLKEVVRWMMNRERGPWVSKTEAVQSKPADAIANATRITFINHSSFLIQTSGINILTDPVFSERVSPFSFVGPKRMRPTGIAFKDLPQIDIVLLSHNHYDHLDKGTLLKIKQVHNPLFVVPLGVGEYLNQLGIRRWETLDWWQSTFAFDVSITAVPAQHFSGRGFFDRDATLWCGYVFKSKSHTIYFAGDTGYNPTTFSEIGNRVEQIDIALIPIGAYKPKWFMSPVHCSPEEAVKIHQEVKAKQSIATHFGTFPLGDDGQEEPIKDLQLALHKLDIPSDEFIALKEGVPFYYGSI
jgi:L-ascorbate metabolism protein UlaG (beta-lactamase superfamily)